MGEGVGCVFRVRRCVSCAMCWLMRRACGRATRRLTLPETVGGAGPDEVRIKQYDVQLLGQLAAARRKGFKLRYAAGVLLAALARASSALVCRGFVASSPSSKHLYVLERVVMIDERAFWPGVS